MKKINIIVATHKKYKMPRDKMYVPVHVGSEGKEENIDDDKNSLILLIEKIKNICKTNRVKTLPEGKKDIDK